MLLRLLLALASLMVASLDPLIAQGPLVAWRDSVLAQQKRFDCFVFTQSSTGGMYCIPSAGATPQRAPYDHNARDKVWSADTIVWVHWDGPGDTASVGRAWRVGTIRAAYNTLREQLDQSFGPVDPCQSSDNLDLTDERLWDGPNFDVRLFALFNRLICLEVAKDERCIRVSP